MCCFSQPVKFVSNTNIFARMGWEQRQYLVYSMKLDASKELAMVLPIPVAHGSGEDAVHFINLEKYPKFFVDLAAAWPTPHPARLLGETLSKSESRQIKVVQVGSFEASFVPTIRDFERLDKRFRLPPDAFDKLPAYRNYGFAIFKLKPGNQNVHPMAFRFPTALPSRLFFPTVHIHDGKVHPKTEFDHALYCQPTDALRLDLSSWDESPSTAEKYVKIKDTADIVVANEHLYQKTMKRMIANTDTFAKAVA